MKKTSVVIIDGSNFYYKLKELKLENTRRFDYSKFVKLITEDTQVKAKYYCIGKIQASQRDKKARQMMAKQQSLVTRLQKEGFIIQFGYLLKSDSRYHEKGVDVQIATNLLAGAFHNLYKQVFLVTSDSDLIPAITEVKGAGKEVVYIGFEHQPSLALLKTCSRSRLLTTRDLLPLVPREKK